MQTLLSLITIYFLAAGCQGAASKQTETGDTGIIVAKKKDTIPPLPVLRPYSDIEYEKKELLTAAGGTKSVLFNTAGTKLYAMNLEGMSVYEFDQASRKISKEFKFTPTRGTGWDYNKSRPIASFQEKTGGSLLQS